MAATYIDQNFNFFKNISMITHFVDNLMLIHIYIRNVISKEYFKSYGQQNVIGTSTLNVEKLPNVQSKNIRFCKVLADVYAENSVEHILSGKAVSRSLRGLFLVQSSLKDLFFDLGAEDFDIQSLQEIVEKRKRP